ncbi:MAG: hypothetical protein IPH56_04185 [Chitinophagaceae bacterium]|nr:hypothetical protein [Chitinophagaceae bacterium]
MIQKIKGIFFVVAMLFLFISIISLFIPSKISNASAVVINAPQEEILQPSIPSKDGRPGTRQSQNHQ